MNSLNLFNQSYSPIKSSIYLSILLLLLTPLFNTKSLFCQQEIISYYKTKKMNPKNHIWEYPAEFKLSKQKALKQPLYYKIFQITDGKIVKEERYFKNIMVSHYIFHYQDDQLIKEEAFDNLVLLSIRLFSYHDGQLTKIETRDKDQNLFGDKIFFDSQENILKIERYHKKKLSFVKLYKNGQLIETRYHYPELIKITKYDENGAVLLEREITDISEANIIIVKKSLPILTFASDTIVKIQIESNSNQIICEKKAGKWLMTMLSTPLQVDQASVEGLIKNITFLKSMTVYEADNIINGKYGIEKSRNKIILWDNQGNKLQLIIGNHINEEKAYYVSTKYINDTLFVVSQDKIDYLLNKKINDLRGKQFVKQHLNTKKLRSISVDGILFIKKSHQWKLRSRRKKNKKQIQAVINTIFNLRALNFIELSQEIREFNLLKPKHKIILSSRQKKYKILIYLKGNKAFAKTNFSKTIYQVPLYFIHYLNEKNSYFRSKRNG